jgi:hypothetical protein
VVSVAACAAEAAASARQRISQKRGIGMEGSSGCVSASIEEAVRHRPAGSRQHRCDAEFSSSRHGDFE